MVFFSKYFGPQLRKICRAEILTVAKDSTSSENTLTSEANLSADVTKKKKIVYIKRKN